MAGEQRGIRQRSRSGESARASRRRRWAALAVALSAGGPFTQLFAQGPYFGPGLTAIDPIAGMPIQAMAGAPARSAAGMPVQPTALSTPDERPLPPQIAALPKVQEELEVIHHRSQLVVGRGRIVRTAVADTSVIEVVPYSENEIDVIGVALGTTTLAIWFENDPEPLIYLVTVVRDPGLDDRRRVDYGKLERRIRELFPNSQVYLVPLSYKIVVKGQARDAEEAAKIMEVIRGEVINQEGALPGPQPGDGTVAGGTGYAGPGLNGVGVGVGWQGDVASSYVVNMLEVPGERQVMIRVRIAELNREQLRRMGVDLGFAINGGRQLFDVASGGLGSNFSAILENGQVTVLLNWLASNGTAKILAEPALTVLSGHPASFLSGGEFAVPTTVGLGGVGVSNTTFRGFGTSLVVTPMVLDKDLIRMRIIPEYSEIDSSTTVGGIPGLNSRRVQTTVELREGQTIAMAGLIGRQTRAEVSRIPFLGDLPCIGPKLFASKRATEDETELLILVTPELVRPMEPDEVPPVPGYYVTHPSDCQLYFHGMTEGPPDLGVYQVGPIGRGATYGREVGYHVFEPAPATPLYSPSVPYPNGNVAPIQVPPTVGPAGPAYPTPAYGGQGFSQGYGAQNFAPSYGPQGFGPGYGDGMSGQPPLPPGGQYPPVAPPAEQGGPLTPIRSRSGDASQPTPAGPLPVMPTPGFGETTGQRSLGDRFRGVLPAGFSRDQNTGRGPYGSAGGWR